MGDRNTMDMDIDQQGQDRIHPIPRLTMGINGNIQFQPHSNNHRVFQVPGLQIPGNPSNMEFRYVPNNRDGLVLNGNQVNGLQHQNTASNMNAGASSSFHNQNPGIIPASGGVVIGMPRGAFDQLPPVGHHGGMVGVGTSENNHFMEGLRISSKRKNTETVPGNHQANGSASSSSAHSFGLPPQSCLPHPMQHLEPVPVMPDSLPVHPPPAPECRINGALPVAGVRPGRSVRSRSDTIGVRMEPPVTHNVNHTVPGTYMTQPFQPTPWAVQQSVQTANTGSSTNWGFDSSYLPVQQSVQTANSGSTTNWGFDSSYLPVQQPVQTANTGSTTNWGFDSSYLPGNSVNGGGVNRNSTIIMNPPTHPHQHLPPPPPPPQLTHTFPHPFPPQAHSSPPGMQAMHVQNGFHLQQQQPPPIPFRQPANHILPQGTTNHSVDDSDIRARQQRVLPSFDLRLLRPHRSGVQLPFPDIWPHMRLLTVDQVAILEGFVESSLDRHRDMRLDIDDMSYEDLLALGEQIGHVETGLPEETLGSRLKTRAYVSSATNGVTRESENCIVCLAEYRRGEMVGILECGHEYHEECIKRWLQVKNVCPVCKLPAINVEDERRPPESPWTP